MVFFFFLPEHKKVDYSQICNYIYIPLRPQFNWISNNTDNIIDNKISCPGTRVLCKLHIFTHLRAIQAFYFR